MPITLQRLAERRRDVTFNYLGDEVTVWYDPNTITKEFRAETLRLQREGIRIQRRIEELMGRITHVEAEDGSPEAKAEDEDAERAIVQLQRDEATLKSQIDGLVCLIVEKWDVLESAGGRMLPLTPEAINPLPADFERACIEAIMNDANPKAGPEGEANGQPSENS